MSMARKGMEEDQMGDNMIEELYCRNTYPYIRHVNAITDFDLNQLHVDQLLDTMNNDDYRLFQCLNKFSHLTVDSKKQ
jgi:hypothetical protein